MANGNITSQGFLLPHVQSVVAWGGLIGVRTGEAHKSEWALLLVNFGIMQANLNASIFGAPQAPPVLLMWVQFEFAKTPTSAACKFFEY